MDPFHVVRLAGDALDQCRRRVQQATCGHHGRTGDPLDAARRTLHTGSDLLTALFADDEHVEVEATWGIYQHMIAAYREPDRKRGRERTLKRRAVDVLADFDRPAPPTGRPRRSTAASNTSAAQPSASATSPTTSPDRLRRPAGSDPDYTLDHEEPGSGRKPTAVSPQPTKPG
jgi:transposase